MTEAAIKVIEGYKSNRVIMAFVESEARSKAAEEIRAAMGGGTTAKAVEILEFRYPNIKDRVLQYVAAGLIGCYLKSLEIKAA